VLVFAREINDPLASLAKKLDAEVGKKKSTKALIMLLTDSDNGEKQLKEFAEKNGLKNVNLGVDNPTGPPNWKIAKDASVTAIFYKARKIEANHAFGKADFNNKAVETVMGSMPKIVASN
jgi:hypothetical protein